MIPSTEAAADAPAETTAWLDGVPASGVRRAEGPESAALVALARRARALAALAIAAAVLCALVLAVSTALLRPGVAARAGLPPEARATTLEVNGLSSLALLAATLVAATALRRREATRRDLVDGRLYAFDLGGAPVVVTRSGRRFGGGAGRWKPRPVSVTARAPADPALYAIPSAEPSAAAAGAERRKLTDGEREELLRHADGARRAWRASGAVALAAWWACALAANAAAPADDADSQVPVLAVFGVVLAMSAWRGVRSFALGSAMLRDAADRWVVRLGSGERAGLEYLPRSGVVWAAPGGQPSPARLGGHAARRAG
jgi:hypothetical protein